MRISRTVLRLSVLIFGLCVLVSYVIGFARSEDVMSFWGGLRENGWKFIAPFMLLAVAGFIIFAYYTLFKLSVEETENMRWPWTSEQDQKGSQRLFLAYTLFLIPSIFWLESTIFHLNHHYTWTPILAITVLWLCALGCILFILLSYAAYKDGIQGSKLMLLGTIFLGIQCIINDGIIWTVLFPWNQNQPHVLETQ